MCVAQEISCFRDDTYESPVTPPSPSPPPAVPESVITGDPHFSGGHSDRFDFAGANNTIYALLSASHLAVNALFVKTTFVMGGTCPACKEMIVHGSHIKAVYFRALNSADKTVRVEYRAEEPSHARLSAEGGDAVGASKSTVNVEVHYEKPDRVQYNVDEVTVLLVRKHSREAAITLSNQQFEVTATSMHLAWAERNKWQRRLDVAIKPQYEVGIPKVAPHGLIGQTFDGDGVAVDGAIDDYSAPIVFTKAMGEGAIEGDATDYVIQRSDPFSTLFKFSRFEAFSAAPRNATKLTGVHRKVEHSFAYI